MADTTYISNAKAFGVVTVMNAHIYPLAAGQTYPQGMACLHKDGTSTGITPDYFTNAKDNLCLDTLKIANLTMEGPTKTITGGMANNTLIKYGKTMTLEMQDALGRAEVLKQFFGCDVNDTTGVISITDKFPGAFAIEGETFVIDQATGEKHNVYIFIPQFLPEAIFNLTQEADGDAAVFDLNGTVNLTPVAKTGDGDTDRTIFYELRDTPWFTKITEQA